MTRYTLAEIKAQHAQKEDWEKQFPVSRFLVRPLSFYLTYAILLGTTSAARVAWAGWLTGVIGCALLMATPELSPWPGVAFLALFSLLDAVDGNIARVTGSVSRYGVFLDGMLGFTIAGSYFLCLAVGLQRTLPSTRYVAAAPTEVWGVPVILMAGALIVACYSSAVVFSSAFSVHALKSGAEPTGGDLITPIGSSRWRGNPIYWMFLVLHSLNIQLTLLILSLALGRVDLFLYLFAAYYLVRAAVMFVYYMWRAPSTLG